MQPAGECSREQRATRAARASGGDLSVGARSLRPARRRHSRRPGSLDRSRRLRDTRGRSRTARPHHTGAADRRVFHPPSAQSLPHAAQSAWHVRLPLRVGHDSRPTQPAVAGPAQAICDLVYLAHRARTEPRSLYTFRKLTTVEMPADLLARYPKTVQADVRRLVGEARKSDSANVEHRLGDGESCVAGEDTPRLLRERSPTPRASSSNLEHRLGDGESRVASAL